MDTSEVFELSSVVISESGICIADKLKGTLTVKVRGNNEEAWFGHIEYNDMTDIHRIKAGEIYQFKSSDFMGNITIERIEPDKGHILFYCPKSLYENDLLKSIKSNVKTVATNFDVTDILF